MFIIEIFGSLYKNTLKLGYLLVNQKTNIWFDLIFDNFFNGMHYNKNMVGI